MTSIQENFIVMNLASRLNTSVQAKEWHRKGRKCKHMILPGMQWIRNDDSLLTACRGITIYHILANRYRSIKAMNVPHLYMIFFLRRLSLLFYNMIVLWNDIVCNAPRNLNIGEFLLDTVCTVCTASPWLKAKRYWQPLYRKATMVCTTFPLPYKHEIVATSIKPSSQPR